MLETKAFQKSPYANLERTIETGWVRQKADDLKAAVYGIYIKANL